MDPDFSPKYESLYDPMVTKKYPFQNAVHFKRPHEFMEGDISIFSDGIDPNDIKGGELQDHWFLSALHTISENPNLV